MNKSRIGLLIAGLAAFSGLTLASVSAAPSSDTPQGTVTSGIKDLPTVVPTTTGGGTATTTMPPTTGSPQRGSQIVVPPVQVSPATTTKKRSSGAGGVLPSLALEPGGSEVPEAPWSP